MDAADKRMLEREALRNMIQQWNANRLDLFELSEPNENLEFHGVMRFYFQDSGQKIATKCIRVASDATVSDVIETLIEKFRPDMRMLSLGSYSLWETHGPDDERRLEPHEKPLLVQLNWHADDREGRFLLKCSTNSDVSLSTVNEKGDQNFKRKLSKREKKELKKKEKLSRLKSDTNNENRPVAEKLYTELPETSFTRSISNPEAVMRRRRQQKLERKLQQFRSKDGGPDTGGTLKIYGSSLSPDVPYKTLLLSVGDTAAGVVREMLDKYGLSRHDPHHFCIVQVDTADNSESILEDDECPLAIVMTHPHRSSIMFHVRRRPADSQPRRRKKKTTGVGAGCGAGGSSARPGCEPMLVEVAPDGSPLENGRRVRITGDMLEVGSGNGSALQLYGPSIQPRHCLVAAGEAGGFTATPLHADAQVYVNGRRAVAPHSLPLQHGCLLKFGRVSTFRFVDPNQENLLNRNLSQSQHFGSGSIYDRSGSALAEGEERAASPARGGSPAGPDDPYQYRDANDTLTPYNNNTLKLDNDSVLSHASKDDYLRDDHASHRNNNSNYKDNYETTFDLDGNVETKSICSAKSGGSGHDNRMSATVGSAARPGQEAILPAVLEFPEAGQAQFLAAVITRLDPHAPAFKLAPVYTLYLCARYRASTHYRPELTPTERAHKLTAFLHHVATLIHATVQERCTDSAAQAFWMANASELLHFLKCDRHISSFSTQAQELLPATVQNAFSNLVSCFQEELSRALGTLTSPALGDATEATAPTLQALAAAMVLLRRCRVNAALTIQLFSHLFHYINAVCFNKLVTEPGTVSARWGAALAARLALLAAWAERQGLELPADCHLARTHQAARLISGTYRTGAEARAALAACFKLNSVQVRALLTPLAPPDVVDAAAAHATALADELCKADGREITLEESCWLGVGLLIPGDGFSAEVVRGVPPGLAEFVAPLQRGGLCRLAHQPLARGVWTVYMAGYGAAARRPPDPALHIIQLNKNSNGMGLSIVAAKGAGQSKLGIYIKSVVAGGAAAADGRLAAGDQLLSVDGQSLVGITQEKAAEYLVRTGPTVTLEVAKQGAVLHGLATLLHQPAYNQKPAGEGAAGAVAGAGAARRASERDLPARLAAEPVKPSKSTPALHHELHDAPPPPPHGVSMHSGSASVANVAAASAASAAGAAWAGRSRSSHNLTAAPHDGFYQNLPAHEHALQDRWSSLRSSTGSNRPQSAHYAPAPLDAPASPASPAPPQHHPNQQTAMARSAKLAEMSEEVTRRQHMQYQLAQKAGTLPPHAAHAGLASPAHYTHPPHPPMSPTMHLNMHHQQNMQQGMQQAMHVSNMQQGVPQNIQGNVQAMQQNMHQMHQHMHAPPMSPPQPYQHAGQPQRYEWHPPGPPSPQRAQPPVAPKPQGVRRSESELEEQYQQQTQPQPTMIQPDDERYVASAMEPLAVSPYGGAPRAVAGAGAAAAHNPWQREERERQAEARRAHARSRRDAAIAALVALGAARSPAQSQQLRALQLERDFERRASQHKQEDNANMETGVDEDSPSPPPEPGRPQHETGRPQYEPNRQQYESSSRTQHESGRLQQEPGRPQLEPGRPQHEQGRPQYEPGRPQYEPGRPQYDPGRPQYEPGRPQHEPGRPQQDPGRPPPDASRAPPPPKSILKTNTPRPEVTNGYAQDTAGGEESVSEAAAGVAALSVAPPPPPERGSSFAVMATRARALSPPEHTPTPHSPPGQGRDKRVSFHERAQAAPAAAPAPPAPPASSPPPLDPPANEDPDRFLEEAESMLGASPAAAPAHTPGVIGAQEVYRDPRARRLAEKQQAAASAAPVPEHLSFKDKMKMFALEAGDPNTPKDKVKISRAQRDIDAVH